MLVPGIQFIPHSIITVYEQLRSQTRWIHDETRLSTRGSRTQPLVPEPKQFLLTALTPHHGHSWKNSIPLKTPIGIHADLLLSSWGSTVQSHFGPSPCRSSRSFCLSDFPIDRLLLDGFSGTSATIASLFMHSFPGPCQKPVLPSLYPMCHADH